MLVPTASTEKTDLSQNTQLLNCFERYLKTDVANGDAADDTLKTYRCHIAQFLLWCALHQLHPFNATRQDLKEYRYWLIANQGYRSTTVALKLSVVRRFYAALIESDYLAANPALGLKPPTEVKDPAARINYLQPDEMYQLLDSLPSDELVGSLRDRLLVAVMVLEGCRTVEMHRACVGDLVREGTDIGLRVQGKRSIRVVPLTPDLAQLLKRYLSARRRSGETLIPARPLFVALDRRNAGKRLSRRSIQRVVDKYLRAIGLKKLPSKKKEKPQERKKSGSQTEEQTKLSHKRHESKFKPPQRSLSAHSLRHTAATLALRAGASLRQVQDLLGHADPRTTVIYAHIADRWRNNPALWLNCPAL